MKTVRFGTFETNSSSCHSLTISDELSDKLMDIRKKLEAHGTGEYGWSGTVRYPEEKLDYYLVDLSYLYHDDKDGFEKKLEEIKNYFMSKGTELDITPAYSNSKWQLLEGYIDHESIGTVNYMTLDELYDWVFTNGTGVHLLNDNSYYGDEELPSLKYNEA